MIKNTSVIMGALLVVIALQSQTDAQSQSDAQTEAVKAQGTVYLHETFDDHAVDSVPRNPQLQRVDKVTVIEGKGKVGSGKVARFDDSDVNKGGSMEYNVGASGQGSLYLSFDACNNAPLKGDKSSTVILGAGPWGAGKSLMLNSKARRAFGFEMYQHKYLKLRVGDDPVADMQYDPLVPFNVKIWVNDHDKNSLSYQRPDNGESAKLNPDSVVVWVNDALIGKLAATGCAMNTVITKGDAVVGRVGFSSSSTKVADFLIDNLHIENPSAGSKPTDQDESKTDTDATSTNKEKALDLPGGEPMAFREGENAMNLFVFKPVGWKATDKRSAFIYFFGGGWTKGTPLKSASTAAWAAKNGMIGIAPDYRTKDRFGTSPLASVDDGRAAFHWVVEHADELGIDPARIAVGGVSAGGHVALWTAIEKAPPGSNPSTSPKSKPAALFLKSAVTDTSPETGYTPKRFGDDAAALSPVHQLDAKMPPTLIFHAANDELVHYSTAVALHDKLDSTGNACELVTVPIGGHGFSSEHQEWKLKVRAKLKDFFEGEGLLPAM
jgi:acetyl esterase/lipase